MAQNEALGKAPTLAEEMTKFQGFAIKDGEVFDGSQKSEADIRAAAESREKAAGEINNRSHKDNQAAGTTSTDGSKLVDKGADEVKLTEDEEEAALQALVAKGRNPDSLTQDEMHKAIADALAAKKDAAVKAAEKAANKGKSREERNASRYDENYRARRTAERRADDLQRQIDELKAVKTPLTDATKPYKDDLVAPDHTDTAKYQYGELDTKYIADLARYETLKALADAKSQQSTAQQSEADKQAAAEFKDRVVKFAEDAEEIYPDFNEVVMETLKLPPSDPDSWPLSRALGELVLESEFGHQIAYELASDPKEARKIAKLSDARQAIWFGQREAEISAGSAAKAKDTSGHDAGAAKQDDTAKQSQARESKAPIPLRTRLNGSGGNRVPNSATTDFSAFEAMTKQKRG